MTSRRTSFLLVLCLMTGSLFVGASARAAGPLDPPVFADGPIKAGYGEADATWHVGAGAGQYTAKDPDNVVNSVTGGEVDPHGHSIAQKDSYGVQSRLSYRALVVEDSAGDQVAFVKSDSYLAQDLLLRRAGQILLASGSDISFEEMFHMASHNHSSPYYMTPAPGPWIFQDAFDIRAFEYHARVLAQSVLNAEAALKPARMGATTVDHRLFKGMIQRKGIADDGTPRGYPDDFGDFSLPIVRFDNIEDPSNPKPIATFINWGQHPEGLDDHDLITGDFIAPLERFVERATGAPLVFGQGDVGSAEAGPGRPDLVAAEGIPARWSHAGHAQGERGAYLLARDVIAGYNAIAEGNVIVPFTSNFDVAAGNAWVAGPYSHPYPSVSNCRTETTVEGAPTAPGPPECIRAGEPDPNNQLWEQLKEAGVQLPDNYDLPSFLALEENTRLHLQAFKIGDVIVASCACESQVDLILNFESRANDITGDQWDGFDWTTRMDCSQNADTTWTCERKEGESNPQAVLGGFTVSDYRYRRMLAQIHNPADGWDAPENINKALSEPYNPEEIFGNFSSYELTPDTGYKLAIGVGHASDYNGYTISYREYQSWDDYRKSLTSYGPHTADYMVTRMVRLAGTLNGVESLELEADIARGLPDEARQLATASALGAVSLAAYEAWVAALPIDSVPVTPEDQIIEQPDDVEKFGATTFSWYGGSNAIDNPTVAVERLVDDRWESFADQSGEIQTKLDFPDGVNAFADTYSGRQSWPWTANFEAFDAFPAEIGSTPPGEYRFVVEGKFRSLPSADSAPARDTAYRLESDPFTVSLWDGIEVGDLTLSDDGSVSFADPMVKYPTTYDSVFPYVNGEKKNDENGKQFCTRCSFRPWASGSFVVEAVVTVVDDQGNVLREVPATKRDGVWRAETDLYRGESAFIAAGGVKDANGEINGAPSPTVVSDRERQGSVTATVLEFTADSAGSGQFGDAVVLQARLTGAGSAISGRTVEFDLAGRRFQATTGQDGVATVETLLSEDPGQYLLSASFSGVDGVYGPSSTGSTLFIVEREDTALELLSSGKGSRFRLTAILTEDDNGVAGKGIDFYADGVLIGSAVTDPSGSATIEVPARFRGGKHEYQASYSGDQYYKPSLSTPV